MNEEEFNLRARRLGKRKNHLKEYELLKEILMNPFPMKLEGLPEEAPDTYGWLYFNLEKLIEKEPLDPLDLTRAVKLVDKIVALAWDLRNSRGKRFADTFTDEYITIANRIPGFAKEINLQLEEGKLMNFSHAKTLLHYFRFDVPDYEKNLWEQKK